ncbi:MAG: hypothetical protein LBQ50_08795 [Planctomycetaceae bacterium]|jgi:hypothetical protein|nr:hypothetical protein [Planctomycetaceae bacterium]
MEGKRIERLSDGKAVPVIAKSFSIGYNNPLLLSFALSVGKQGNRILLK